MEKVFLELPADPPKTATCMRSVFCNFEKRL